MTSRTDAELLDEIENSNDGQGPDPIYTVGPELAAIAAASLSLRAAEIALDAAVAQAREQGQTWQAIGEVLGMTRQGALKRFRNAA
ncbi:hypothetical protein [Tessaracoccus caeni]|uniref:hypothetical protein n=1 Tax=Tessaracoccus caeni TaxID=3031239 RepID=UPI0023DAEA4B|nr:hypothetical protein [Tessaracoccus caeni]MDF1489614.1 hypothetical protein [Tessaracoccus caeni]